MISNQYKKSIGVWIVVSGFNRTMSNYKNMSIKKPFVIISIIFFVSHAFSALAQEATSTSSVQVTSTPESVSEVATSTLEVIPTSPEPATTTPPASESLPLPPQEPAPAPFPTPALLPPPPPEPAPTFPVLALPPLPEILPVVPFTSVNGRGFDPATAPSIVRIKVLNPNGSTPTSAVFVSFIGVGGRSYGGPLDREGNIKAVMPSGRYYADFLVVDTHYGPPPNAPAFFLEANEERDLGVIQLSNVSSFTDTALEAEVAQTLEGERGMAKIFSLIVKLLLAILKEVRGIRVDMLDR